MCIIKEINMLDLNANDRQMALNEVKVLSKMDHPNIVGKTIRQFMQKNHGYFKVTLKVMKSPNIKQSLKSDLALFEISSVFAIY